MEQTITVDHHNNPKKQFVRSILDHENEEGSLKGGYPILQRRKPQDFLRFGGAPIP